MLQVNEATPDTQEYFHEIFPTGLIKNTDQRIPVIQFTPLHLKTLNLQGVKKGHCQARHMICISGCLRMCAHLFLGRSLLL